MPRSRSMSIRSRYCARICRGSTTPVICSIRSASVDLPWSMWAMMQKLRMRAGSVAPGLFAPGSSVGGTVVRSGRRRSRSLSMLPCPIGYAGRARSGRMAAMLAPPPFAVRRDRHPTVVGLARDRPPGRDRDPARRPCGRGADRRRRLHQRLRRAAGDRRRGPGVRQGRALRGPAPPLRLVRARSAWSPPPSRPRSGRRGRSGPWPRPTGSSCAPRRSTAGPRRCRGSRRS